MTQESPDYGLRRDETGWHLTLNRAAVPDGKYVTMTALELATFAGSVFTSGVKYSHPTIRRSIERTPDGKVAAFLEEPVV